MRQKIPMGTSIRGQRLALWMVTLLFIFGIGAFASAPPRVAAQISDINMNIIHTGTSGDNFLINTTGSVTVIVANNGVLPKLANTIIVSVSLPGNLTYSTPQTSSPNNLFTCSAVSSSVNCSNTGGGLDPSVTETITFNVVAPSTPLAGPYTLSATLFLVGDTGFLNAQDLTPFSIIGPTSTPSLTPTITPTRTITPTVTIFPTITSFPTVTPVPTNVPTGTPTLIPNPPTRTPPPRPANAGQAVGPIARPGVRVVVDRDGVNVRITPAIGAEPIAFVNAGTTFDILARSPDNEWVLVVVGNQLGWIGTAVLAIIQGDLNAAPVADPRTIPYGGFENPRAGITSVTSAITGKLELSGLRVRGGPGLGYPVLANAPRYTIFSLLGQALGGSWVQVNFEGTLGWVVTEFVALQQDLSFVSSLPEDGIVADGLPVSEPTTDSYTDTLRLMLARVELAQPSLDTIRAIWTSIAVGERAACGNYPARPTDYNIPNPVLAPFYGTLFPLQEDFNAAMTSLRLAIDLFIDICSRPQPPEGFVGQAVVQNALDAINAADGAFASLRGRLRQLLPPDQPLTDDQCLFTFNQRSEILDRLRLNTAKIITMSDSRRVIGLCFDAAAGQTLNLQALKVNGTAQPRLTVTSFDNPTNFLAVSEFGTGSTTVSISNIVFTQTGRYLLLVSDLDAGSRGVRLSGEIALLLTDFTSGGAVLAIDPLTGQVIVQQSGSLIVPSATPFAFATTTSGSTGFCPSITFTCVQLASCDQARACLPFNPTLDGDSDGVPCEVEWCGGN